MVIDSLEIEQIIDICFNNNVAFNQGSIVWENEIIVRVSEAKTERRGNRPKIYIRNLLKNALLGLLSLVGFCIMHIILHHYKKNVE